MSSNELKDLKKTLLKRITKAPKSYWNDGKCEFLEELDQNAHGIIIVVRKTKRKHQPIVIDAKFSPRDGYEESACEISADHAMKMLQSAARYSVSKIKEEEQRICPSNEIEVESSSSASNHSAPLSNMQKKTKIIPKTNKIVQDESQITHVSNEMEVESS